MKDLLAGLVEAAQRTDTPCPKELERMPPEAILLGKLPESLRGAVAFAHELLRDGKVTQGRLILALVGYDIDGHFAKHFATRSAEQKPPFAVMGVCEDWSVFGIEAQPVMEIDVIILGGQGSAKRRGTLI